MCLHITTFLCIYNDIVNDPFFQLYFYTPLIVAISSLLCLKVTEQGLRHKSFVTSNCNSINVYLCLGGDRGFSNVALFIQIEYYFYGFYANISY